MAYFLYVAVTTVRLLIDILQLALCIHAIVSWLPLDDDNVFVVLLEGICAPILYPARLLVEKSETLSSLPVDISFIITYIGLMIIGAFLPVIRI